MFRKIASLPKAAKGFLFVGVLVCVFAVSGLAGAATEVSNQRAQASIAARTNAAVLGAQTSANERRAATKAVTDSTTAPALSSTPAPTDTGPTTPSSTTAESSADDQNTNTADETNIPTPTTPFVEPEIVIVDPTPPPVINPDPPIVVVPNPPVPPVVPVETVCSAETPLTCPQQPANLPD